MAYLTRSVARFMKGASVALALAGLCATAHAAYPERPITIIVPFNTGTTPDILSRLLAAEMGRETGASFIVQNRVGASGIIGTQEVINAAPDGYTIGYANVATLAINQSLFKHLSYDADKQLAPIALTGSVQNVLAVRPGLGVKSVEELIALAKKEPGKLSVASGGNGTTGHLSAEMFKSMAGVSILHVPYKGGIEADLAVLRGEADLVFDNTSSIMPYVKQGQVIALAVTGKERDPAMSNLPTLDEQGLKGYQSLAWTGYVAPAHTDPKILDYLNKAINKALDADAVKTTLKGLAYEPTQAPREALFELAHKERPVWAKVIKDAGVTLD